MSKLLCIVLKFSRDAPNAPLVARLIPRHQLPESSPRLGPVLEN